jgi:1,4-alpha-glucan branching enzyme
MGDEFGQWNEWNHDSSLDWHLTDEPPRQGLLRWVGDLNRLYRSEPALHELDFSPEGFSWVDANDADHSIASLLRMARGRFVLAAFNFTPVPRPGYRIGVPRGGRWTEALNSDAQVYGGSGWGNLGGVEAEAVACHNLPWSINLTLPPLGAVFLTAAAPEPGSEEGD